MLINYRNTHYFMFNKRDYVFTATAYAASMEDYWTLSERKTAIGSAIFLRNVEHTRNFPVRPSPEQTHISKHNHSDSKFNSPQNEK